MDELLITNIYTRKISELLSLDGFKGKDLGEALLFSEIKVNEYQVDAPAKLRSAEEKEYASKCKEYKLIVKDIKDFAKIISSKFVYNTENGSYELIKIK
jgi:hypothetical protein